MSDKRKVATDALETLGTIIDKNCKRDAIHLAVEPCIAAEILKPGDHIGIINGKGTTNAIKKLGIVDPFLIDPIQENEMFWLIVYPRTITSLRHVWEHPNFPNKNPNEESKQWIFDFAKRIHQNYNDLMEAAERWVQNEDYTYDNTESYKNHSAEFDEFWKHYEIITGKKPQSKEAFFTCSC